MQERVPLANHPTMNVVPMGGCGALVFGGLFLAAGLGAMLGVHFGELETSSKVPQWVGYAACGIFVFVGGGICLMALRKMIRKASIKRRFELHHDEPWRVDHNWNPRFATDRSNRIIYHFVFVSFLFLFLTPFNWWAFFSKEGVLPVKLIVGLLDLALVAGVGYTLYIVGRSLKYAGARLLFEDFPFFLGHSLRVRFRMPRTLQGFDQLVCVLRCVEEAFVESGEGTQVAAFQIYSEEREIPAASVEGELQLEFALPEDGIATHLVTVPHHYWELEIKAETPGIDYRGLFLLPVYKE